MTLTEIQAFLGTVLYTPLGDPFILTVIRCIVAFLALIAAQTAVRQKAYVMGFLLTVLGVMQLAGALTSDAEHAPALSAFTVTINLTQAGIFYLMVRLERPA